MTIVRQLMRGSTAQADAVTSVVGHLVMDTTRKDLRLYDGVQLGGYIIPTKTTLGTDTGVNVYNSQRLGGQLPAYYQNSSNQNAGTLPAARLSGNYSFTRLTLSDATPLVISNAAAGLITNLDSDKLDGQHGAFYQNSDNQNAGTLPVARLAGIYTGIVGTGVLNIGSITAGFGDIDIGANVFTGIGSGLINLNASNLTTGTVPNARMNGDYSFANLYLSNSLGLAPASGGIFFTSTISSAGNDYLTYDDSINTWTWFADSSSTASINVMGMLRARSGSQAASGSTTHGLQVGDTNTQNIRLGLDRIAFVNNGAYDAGAVVGTTVSLWATNVDSSDPGVCITNRKLTFGNSGNNDFIIFDDATNAFTFNADGSWPTAYLVGGRFIASATAGNTWTTALDFEGAMLYSSDSAVGYVAATNLTAASGYFKRLTDGDVVVFRQTGTTNVGRITITSSATTYNTTSDKRLKTDLRPIDVNLIDQIEVWDFEWVRAPGTRSHGVMAQDAVGIIPDMVSHNTDAYEDENGNPQVYDEWGADYGKMTPLLAAVVKDLRARVSALEAA